MEVLVSASNSLFINFFIVIILGGLYQFTRADLLLFAFLLLIAMQATRNPVFN